MPNARSMLLHYWPNWSLGTSMSTQALTRKKKSQMGKRRCWRRTTRWPQPPHLHTAQRCAARPEGFPQTSLRPVVRCARQNHPRAAQQADRRMEKHGYQPPWDKVSWGPAKSKELIYKSHSTCMLCMQSEPAEFFKNKHIRQCLLPNLLG